MLVRLTNCKKPIQYAPRSQATLVRNRIGSPVRAEKEIGFEAGLPLEQGLQELIAWRRSHIDQVAQRRAAAGVRNG